MGIWQLMSSRVAIFATLAIVATASGSRAADELPTYDSSPSKWITIDRPSRDNSGAYNTFMQRANWSRWSWSVVENPKGVAATLHDERAKPKEVSKQVAFSLALDGKWSKFDVPKQIVQVDDGWLVAYNRGEWGATLWWFSKDGARRYHISSKYRIKQIVSFQKRLFAAEGLNHLFSSEGSIVEISKQDGRWTASTFVKLSHSAETMTPLDDKRLCVVTSDQLLTVSLAREVKVLVPDGDWGSLYPDSIAVDKGANVVYVGMRQFIVRYGLSPKDHTLSFLVPSREFLRSSLHSDRNERP
jgi:hypothetical protein